MPPSSPSELPPSDAILRDGLHRGDLSALHKTIVSYGDRLHKVAFAIVASHDDAADVVQDVFIKVWERREALADVQSLIGYLIRATRNHALNLRKKMAADGRLRDGVLAWDDAGAGVNPGLSHVIADELGAQLREAVAALPPRVREIFLMHRAMGLMYPEIAEQLGISVATVHQQMSRAVRAIAGRIRRDV